MIPTILNKVCSIFILNYTSIKKTINVDSLVHAIQNIPFYVLSRLFHITKAFRRLLFPAFVPIHCVFIHIFIREYESIYVYSYLPLRIFSRYVIKEKEINSIIQYKQADFMVVLQKILPSKRIKNSCVNQS